MACNESRWRYALHGWHKERRGNEPEGVVCGSVRRVQGHLSGMETILELWQVMDVEHEHR